MSQTDTLSNSSAPLNYKKSTKWVMLAFVCILIFMLNGVVYTSFNILLKIVAEDLSWTATERGIVATAYSTGLIWFVFVAGIALDKFSVKKMVGSLLLVLGVLVIARGVITSYMGFYAIMFAYGAVYGFVLPSLTKILGLWFEQKELATANGILTGCSPIGQICGNMLSLPLMAMLGGWKNWFYLQGVIVFVIAVIFWIFAKDRRSIDAALKSTTISNEGDLGIIKNVKAIIKVPQVWMCIVANACVLGIIYGGGSMMYIVFQDDPHWAMPAATTGAVVSTINFASMIAYFVVPLITQRIYKTNYLNKYMKTAIVAGIICSLITFYSMTSYNLSIAFVTFFISGLTHGSLVPAPKIIMLQLPQVSGSRAGTALGLYLTFERLSASVITGIVAASLVLNPSNSAFILGMMFGIFYIISPILIFIMLQMEKSKQKKQLAAAAV